MKTVILAGGFDTRLSEEMDVKPKPLVEIGGKSILWHIMKMYASYGHNDFIIGYNDVILPKNRSGDVLNKEQDKLFN